MAWNLQIKSVFAFVAHVFFAYEAVCDVLSGNSHLGCCDFVPRWLWKYFIYFGPLMICCSSQHVPLPNMSCYFMTKFIGTYMHKLVNQSNMFIYLFSCIAYFPVARVSSYITIGEFHSCDNRHVLG